MLDKTMKEEMMLIKHTPETSLKAYIRQVNSVPMLTLEEEKELAEKWQRYEDVAAAQKLVLTHLRLVVKIAQSFRSYEMPIQDIISEGNIGLMKAVKKFDIKMGYRLATYASWWIRAAIQEYILKSWSMLKVSTATMKRKLFCKLQKMGSLIAGKDDDEQLSNLRMMSLHHTSSNEDDRSFLIDKVHSEDTSPEEKMISEQDDQMRAALLKKSIEKLSDREKDILYNRRLRTKPVTLESLAKKYSVSQERIRQIEGRIIEKLRTFTMAGIATVN